MRIFGLHIRHVNDLSFSALEVSRVCHLHILFSSRVFHLANYVVVRVLSVVVIRVDFDLLYEFELFIFSTPEGFLAAVDYLKGNDKEPSEITKEHVYKVGNVSPAKRELDRAARTTYGLLFRAISPAALTNFYCS